MSCPASPVYTSLRIHHPATYGVYPPPGPTDVCFGIGISGFSPSTSRNLVDNPLLRGARDSAKPFRGNLSVGGSFDHVINFDEVGHLYKHLFGAPVATTSPYVFVPTALPTAGATLSLYHSDIAIWRNYSGVKFDTASWAFSTEGAAMVTFGWLGKKNEDPETSEAFETITNYAAVNCDQFSAAITKTGGGSLAGIVTELTINYSNNILSDIRAIGDAGEVSCLPEQLATVDGTMTVHFIDEVLLQEAIDNGSFALTATWTDETPDDHTISIPEIVFEVSDPDVGGVGSPVNLTLSWKAYCTLPASTSIMTVTVNNRLAVAY
jgi:hypothetical protein